MNRFRFATILLIVTVPAACAIGYQARGSLSDVAGELRGKGYPGTSGGGRFVLNDQTGRLICDGIANPPATPHFVIQPDGTAGALVTGIQPVEAVLAQVGVQP